MAASILGAAPGQWATTATGLLIPAPSAPRYDQPVGIDLFAGAGGFSCGFHQAGFHMAAAVEYDIGASITYLVNCARPGVKIHFDTPEREEQFTAALERHFGLRAKGKPKLTRAAAVAGSGWISHRPAWERGCEHFFHGDVRNFTGRQILGALGLERGDVTAVCGGPPCQGFSMAGKRDVMDSRNSLVFEFARLVLEIWPKAFVMENVPNIISMLTPEGMPVIDAFCRVMSDGGFGAYDALRKGLAAQAATAGALRRDKPAPKRRGYRRPVTAEEPATLFEVTT